jgi:putative ABC transport system permease protein
LTPDPVKGSMGDIRYGLRLLRKSPGFAVVAILTLGLGIGANTAIFSTVDALLIRALPYADPDRIVMVWEDAHEAGFPRNTPAPGSYGDWTRLNRSFVAIAATRGVTANLTGGAVPEQVIGRAVTPQFFSVLGVNPVVGRAFTEAEDRSNVQVAVISYGLWQRRFGGQPAAIGSPILMNGNRYEIIGVMPRDFVFRSRDVDYWIPMSFSSAAAAVRTSHFLNVVARLAPGVTLDAARDDMRRVDDVQRQEYPEPGRHVTSVLVPIADELLGDTRLQLLVLMAAAAAVLLIACANLASLLLSRAAGRRGELAVRAALGATRGRLVRQMVTEATMFSLLGGVLGLTLAPAGVAVMAQLTPRGFPPQTSSVLDLRLLAFAFVVSVTTGIVFGLVPALQAARASLRDAMQQGASASVGGRGRLTRDALVVLQVAAALVLLAGAGLMLRTMANLRGLELGFRPDHLLTMRTTLPQSKYREPAQRLSFYDRVIADVRALPGVEGAAYASVLPFLSPGNTLWFAIDGITPSPDDPQDTLFRVGTSDYLKTLGVQLVEGRLLDQRDGVDAPRAVVVNDTLARKYWPRRSALGGRMRLGDAQGPWYTIVGVVKDVRERGHTLAQKPLVYLTNAQRLGSIPEYLVLRTASAPADLVESIRRVIARIDPDQPISAVRTMDEIVDLDVADRHQQMILLGAFAGLALLLASIGLYGVLSYAVTQRSREIGLRIALGATAGTVLRLVVARGLILTAIGLSIGLAVAWAATRALQSVLYGVSAGDSTTYATVVALLASIALLASYLPARRASRLDPISVLRAD